MEEKKLGLKSVISVSVGLVIATSCLVSLGQGAGTIGVTFIFAMVIKSNWFMYQCRDGACPVSTTNRNLYLFLLSSFPNRISYRTNQ